MADPELEEIRRARLAELQQQGGTQDEQRKQVETERRSAILNQILEPEAIDRLNRIRLVNGPHVAFTEKRLIGLAESGHLRQRVTDEQLKDLLNAIKENQEQQKLVVNRRKGGWDDEDPLSGL